MFVQNVIILILRQIRLWIIEVIHLMSMPNTELWLSVYSSKLSYTQLDTLEARRALEERKNPPGTCCFFLYRINIWQFNLYLIVIWVLTKVAAQNWLTNSSFPNKTQVEYKVYAYIGFPF